MSCASDQCGGAGQRLPARIDRGNTERDWPDKSTKAVTTSARGGVLRDGVGAFCDPTADGASRMAALARSR